MILLLCLQLLKLWEKVKENKKNPQNNEDFFIIICLQEVIYFFFIATIEVRNNINVGIQKKIMTGFIVLNAIQIIIKQTILKMAEIIIIIPPIFAFDKQMKEPTSDIARAIRFM